MKTQQKLSPLTLFLLALISLMHPAGAAEAISLNKSAPDFSLQAADGTTYTLSKLRGQIVVLEWINHDCPFVKKHYDSGNMQTLQRHAAEQGVVWLSINSSAPGKQGHLSPDEAKKITKKKKAAPAALLLDPEGTIGRLFGARTTPHMFVIDQEGVLRYMGAIDSIPSADKADVAAAAENYVTQALASLMDGRQVAKQSTPPYGCSVKY